MSLLDTASLLLTPNAYKEGKLYSVIPSDGSGDFTFTRATTATRVNSDGLVELVPYNLLERSEEFANAYWTKNTSTITTNATTAPNGTATADKLIGNNGATFSGVQRNMTVTNATAYTISVYLKAAEATWLQVIVSGVTGTSPARLWINLTNGVLGTNNGGFTSASIESSGNGWYRVLATFTTTSTSSQMFFAAADGDNINAFTCNGVNGLFLWGAQLVEGTNALPYQKTETRLNIPRLDYSLGGCPNILLEPQRTNTLTYSDQFDNAAWTKLNGTITPNTIASPSDISNADTFTDNSTNAVHGLFRGGQWSTTQQTFTIYVKPNTLTKCYIQNGTTGAGAFFDLTTGTVEGLITGSANPMVNASITPMINGWFRVSATHTALASQTLLFGFYKVFNPVSSGLSSAYIGTGQTAYVWGAQLEAGSYATSYIPTTTASVTRNVDTMLLSNIYTNNLITPIGGTWFVDLENNVPLTRDGGGNLFIDTSSSGFSNGWSIRNIAEPNARFRIVKYIASISSVNYTTTTDNIKIAIKWNGTTADVFLNGVKVVSNTPFTTTNMQFLGGNGSDHPKYINSMLLAPTPLTDDECIQLTTI